MFSEPVTGEHFFGRTEVLELLNKRVAALKEGYRQNIALTGHSLVGKSSLILHFIRTIRSEGFVPVYVEIVKEPFRSFAHKFIATLLYNTFQRSGEPANNIEFEKLLARTQRTLPKTAHAIKHILQNIEHDSIDEAYSELLGLTSIVKSETGFPCIVIFDEFDNFEWLGIKNPFTNFSKVIMVQKDTMYIVSSSRNQAIKKIISEKLSLLFGNFELVKVTNFENSSARAFIDMRLSGFDLEDGLKTFLVLLTDGNPFYLNTLLARLRQHAIERMSSYIDADIAADCVFDLLYDSNGTIHQYLMTTILHHLDTRTRDSQLSILVAIAHNHNTLSKLGRALKGKQCDISKTLTQFLSVGLISKNGVFYKIDDAMLAFWLANVYQKKKDLLIDGSFDKKIFFRGAILSHIRTCIDESRRPVCSRIVDLVNSFSNDLVQIDERQMRLPHFTKVELRELGEERSFILASFSRNLWLIRPFAHTISENEIIDFIKDSQSLNAKIAHKVIIALGGIDENAKLLAKELKISIWGIDTVNMLFNFYNKQRVIVL